MPIAMRCLSLFLALLIQPPGSDTTELVRNVEEQRGGRHWIDQPTDPPKSAAESQQCFELEPGCRIELVAAEPTVLDPVWIDFDHRGRLFVTEYGDYPTGPADPESPPLSRIVLLTDSDADGRLDRRTVFADRLDFCHSFLPLFDGLLACTQTEILFLKDTDGDDVADVREVWFDGFTPAHPQMQIGCPQRGFDGRIWLTYGPGNIRCRRPGFESEAAVTLPRNDFCFDPVTMEFDSVTGLGQFGNTIDNEGHRFFCTNRNPIMMAVFPRTLLQEYPQVGIGSGHTDVGPSGENTRVYPRVAMKSNWLAHAGTHTSACGVTAYRGHLFDESFRHSVFACEPVGHLITRSVIRPDGAALTAERARERQDFLTSTDSWFRPASLRTGPDGAIYVADMYRLWVEHPKFVPPDVAEKMDWRAGEHHGRIWRIVPDKSAPDAATSDDAGTVVPDGSDPVALLRSPNGWHRDLGQRLICEQQRSADADALREILHDDSLNESSRLQAMWTLHGLNRLTSADLVQAADDKAGCVRRDAVRLLNRVFPNDPAAHHCFAKRSRDPHGETRLQAVLGLVHAPVEQRGAAISEALTATNSDHWIHAAGLIAASGMEGQVLALLARNSTGGAHTTSPAAELIRRFSAAAAATATSQQLTTQLSLIAQTLERNEALAAVMLQGLDDGLRRNRTEGIPRSLVALSNHPPADAANTVDTIRGFVAAASHRALDDSRSMPLRLQDIELLSFSSVEELRSVAGKLLNPSQPLEIQRAALQAVRSSGGMDEVRLLLESWSSLSPSVQASALDWLLSRRDALPLVLDRMTSGSIPPAAVNLDQRMRLLQHPDAEVRQVSAGLFGGAVSANRREVADRYAEALQLTGSVERGRSVFQKTCSRCHRIDGSGHQVGPDISDTRNRSRDALLYDILDPNRRVDPQFGEYLAVTVDGLVLNGLLVSETPDAVVLRQVEAKEQTLPRSQIEELRATQKSLMPEGVEKEIDVQQMADLLEFLKAR